MLYSCSEMFMCLISERKAREKKSFRRIHPLHIVLDIFHVECKDCQCCCFDERSPNKHRSNQKYIVEYTMVVYYHKFQRKLSHISCRFHFHHNIVRVEHSFHPLPERTLFYRNNLFCKVKYRISEVLAADNDNLHMLEDMQNRM